MQPTSNPTLAWSLLALSGVMEVAFALSIQHSNGFTRPLATTLVFMFGGLSVYLMSLTLGVIPIGTAYAVWGGIGAVGTVVLGLVIFGESASPARLACIALIIAGVVGLHFLEAR